MIGCRWRPRCWSAAACRRVGAARSTPEICGAGDTAVIYGVGGLGINAVQGAISAGCKYVVVVDPVALKRETALKFGATHAFADAAGAAQKVDELTWGQGADAALILVGTVDEEVVSAATAVIGKGGTVVITGLADPTKLTVHVSGTRPDAEREDDQGIAVRLLQSAVRHRAAAATL